VTCVYDSFGFYFVVSARHATAPGPETDDESLFFSRYIFYLFSFFFYFPRAFHNAAVTSRAVPRSRVVAGRPVGTPLGYRGFYTSLLFLYPVTEERGRRFTPSARVSFRNANADHYAYAINNNIARRAGSLRYRLRRSICIRDKRTDRHVAVYHPRRRVR